MCRSAKAYIEKNILIEVERLAREKGHRILFTPPYHSDFQPIELVWALVKGNVGRQYSNDTTLEIVYQRLVAEFGKLQRDGSHSISGMIKKSVAVMEKFYSEFPMDEAVEMLAAENDDFDAEEKQDDESDDDSDELG